MKSIPAFPLFSDTDEGIIESEKALRKYDCVLLVLCAEACCAMGDLGSARDYLTKAAKQAAWFDGVDSSKICDSKLFAEMGIMKK